MALYLQRQFRLIVSAVQNMVNPLVERGGSGLELINSVDELAEASGNSVLVPASQTDYQLAMPASISTGRLLYLETDQDLVIKLGGTEADRAISLKVPSTTIKAVLYLDAEVTSIYVTTGVTATNVYYAVVGD